MKKNHLKIFMLSAGVLLFSMTACSSSSSIDDTPYTSSDNNDDLPTGNVATVFTTTASGTHSLTQSQAQVYAGTNMAPTTIALNASTQYQSIDGFGFGITYSTCYNLLKMSAEDRAAFLKKTYSTTEGFGVSYARISIGCNDFSSTEYSLCDEKGLEHFALQSDETNYVIPILKEILAINPDLKIIAAPWTCPKWMKVNNIIAKGPHDSWTDGHLNPDYYKDYATYFVKFITAMKAQGINIYAVSPQNEPLNKANCASLYMPWAEEAAFVKEMAAAFKQNGLGTKIYLFDHNYNYDGDATQEDYPVKIYNAIGNEYEGAELVVGAAYHDYGGSNTELEDIYAQAPDKELIFSESSIGTWNNGRSLSTRLLEDMKNVTLGTINRQCKAVLVWNLMLDTNMGPNLDGGCQTCYGAVDINPTNYKTLSYNSHYYIISHMSSIASTGAVRIGVSRESNTNGIMHSEFLNPDGSLGIVLINSGDEDKSVNISEGNSYVRVAVPAGGVVSCKWNK